MARRKSSHLDAKCLHLLIVFIFVFFLPHSSTVSGTQTGQGNTEELVLRHLPDGRVMAHFEFTTSWSIHPLTFAQSTNVHHYGIFPKSLAEVISHYHVQELHLSLTQGKWRTRMWGYPPISAPPGAEFWVWFLPDADVESSWPGVVNAMSGMLCAHLNAIGSSSTYNPLHSFKPQGAVIGNLSSSQLRYAALPREAVCTENFTPWTKLLPCGTSAGLSTLFSALKLYDTEFHSLALHFNPVCKDSGCNQVGVELKQTLTVVFPLPLKAGLIDWTLKSLFSKPLTSTCPLSSVSRLLIQTRSHDSSLKLTVNPQPTHVVLDGSSEWAVFDVANVTSQVKKFDIQVKAKEKQLLGMPSPPLLHTQRVLLGSGHEWGGLYTEITNNHPGSEVKLLYLDMVPWFCRVFIHTLQVDNATVLYQHYQPGKDRLKPHMLEMLLVIPPHSTASISVQFNRAFLKWTEHPPDAHHGFYINSAVLTTVLPECPNCTLTPKVGEKQHNGVLRLHTELLLVSLPTPDFSMPYNVICFVCTVIAIAFGSIFNLTTRTLTPVTEKNKGLIARLMGLLKRGGKKEENEECTDKGVNKEIEQERSSEGDRPQQSETDTPS